MLELGQIEHQVVGPQAGPLAHGRRLGRLQMGEAQAGQIAVLLGANVARRSMTATSAVADQLQRLAHQDQVGVVGDVAACGAQVDDRPRRGADVAVGVDVGHHVVPQPPFVGGRGVEVDVVDVGPQLGDLLAA